MAPTRRTFLKILAGAAVTSFLPAVRRVVRGCEPEDVELQPAGGGATLDYRRLGRASVKTPADSMLPLTSQSPPDLFGWDMYNLASRPALPTKRACREILLDPLDVWHKSGISMPHQKTKTGDAVKATSYFDLPAG